MASLETESTRAALLEYYVTKDATLAFLARPGADRPEIFEAKTPDGQAGLSAEEIRKYITRLFVDFNGLPSGWERGDHVDRYKQALELPPSVHAGKRSLPLRTETLRNPRFRYELTYLEHLSRALLPAPLKEALAPSGLVVVVPHGLLHLLPFSALRWSENTYLIEQFGVCQAPSISILRQCQGRNRRRLDRSYRPTSCLVAAVAAVEDNDPAFLENDGQRLCQVFSGGVPPRRATALVGATTHDGTTPASRANILGAMDGYDVIHFACHGLFRASETSGDGNTGLVVSNGRARPQLQEILQMPDREAAEYLISPEDILSKQIRADMVVLRACSAGQVVVGWGDELTGITRAFLYAGTASLIVSLWDVNKQSSQKLLNGFYDRSAGQERVPKWRALRDSQLELLHSEEYAHPYHWAAVQLIGDWL